MARASWFDPTTNLPLLDEEVKRLESFTNAMADGTIDAAELKAQEERLLAAMQAAEALLSDEQHAAVTALLLELSAYNFMAIMRDLQQERLKQVFA